MAADKLEELTIDQIRKRVKDEGFMMTGSIIVFLVCFIGLSIFKPDLTGVTLPILAPAVIAIRGRNKIIEVLMDRIG